MLRLTKRSAISTEINDPGEHLPETRLMLFINPLPAQSCWSQLSQGKIFPKENKITKHFQPILVENITWWWSGYVSKACCRHLAPRTENAIPGYRQIPTQGPAAWADAALTAEGRRALHLLPDLGSSAGSVDQNCSQKSQANAWHRNKFASGFSVSRMSVFEDKINAQGNDHIRTQGIKKF